MIKSKDPMVRAGLLAARAAQLTGLKPGNMWEPAITRHLEREIREHGEKIAWSDLCLSLGIKEKKGT